MKYLIYKITNNVNGKIYVGKHRTNNINDRYMGSGKIINRAYDKYDIKCFNKEILHICESEEEMDLLESSIVNHEFVKRKDTYNIALGGKDFFYKSVDGELIHLSKNQVTVRDKNNNIFNVSLDDPRYLSGELPHVSIGMIWVNKDADRTKILLKDKESYLADGWILGRFTDTEKVKVKKTNKKCINKDGKELRIDNKLINDYLKDGWIIGRLNLNKKCINKDGKELRIPNTHLQKYLNDGWVLGRANLKRSCWRNV